MNIEHSHMFQEIRINLTNIFIFLHGMCFERYIVTIDRQTKVSLTRSIKYCRVTANVQPCDLLAF